ncbi:MAG TPA: histidinol-phosphate transaminase [Candidatus Dormibacteraeota bacterium]
MPPRFLKPALRAFAPYTPGEQPADGGEWVKLNTNEAPWPPSPRVLDAIRAAVNQDLRLYPSPLSMPARRAIAEALGLAPDMVALGNGGDELIGMCLRAFAGAGQRVAWAWPTYPYYEPQTLLHEAVPSPHRLDAGWKLPESFFEDTAPLKFLCNPNSPTGTWQPREVVERALQTAQGVVVVDEAYVDFAPENRADLLDHHGNLVLLRTFSKSASLAGMRIGYALAQPGLIESLDVVKDSYNLDRLAIVAAAAAAQDIEYRERLVEYVLDERAWLAARLAERGFEVAPSATNFIFVRPPAGRAAADLYARLRDRRILVRYYDREPIDGYFRITIGTREQHEALLAALEEIL